MTTDLILGTAGHIDHGKTTLIRCLTGTDTDRLPEEKRRGITIELGFAELDLGEYRLGIVDVPGHERFVRQMLAGATGIDLALLVVAADDSVKPQTREHLDVLRLLEIQTGVIALTKIDVADADWINLVEEEVRELVRGTFLEHAPIVRTSATTGRGLDELRAALKTAARAAAARSLRRRKAPFRMAIDRSFSVAGHGTVVTGSVATGAARVGDTLMLEPGGIEVRVRGLHNHDRSVEQIERGQRAAINLAGVRHEQIVRGHELAARGHLQSSRQLTVHLEVLPDAPRPLKRRDRLRFHAGTAEVLATLLPLGVEQLDPGHGGFAQLYLQSPVVTTWNQPFVLRAESPVATIAGGRVMVPAARKLRKPDAATLQRLESLRSDDLVTRAAAAVYFAATPLSHADELARMAGSEEPAELLQQLIGAKQLVSLTPSGQRQLLVPVALMDDYATRVTAVLESWHNQNPLKSSFDRTKLLHEFAYLGEPIILQTVLQRMDRQKQLRLTDRRVGLAERGPQLSKGEKQLMEQLIERYRTARFQPPSVKECEQAATKNQKSVRSLIALAASDGALVEFGDQMYLHADLEREMRTMLRERFAAAEELTVSEIREVLDTSRKFAVPLCEYLDRIGFTRRSGDARRLNPDFADAGDENVQLSTPHANG